MVKEPKVKDRRPPRIWLPSPHNLFSIANDNYLHSLWLGTVGLLCLLPYMIVFQFIVPILDALVQALEGIFVILGSLLRTIFTVTVNCVLRIAKTFLYGLFGYLNVAHVVRAEDLVPPGPDAGPKQPGMHQRD
jgi:hypothetical protein